MTGAQILADERRRRIGQTPRRQECEHHDAKRDREPCDRFGITVAGAHGELGSRMFRIGHIGYYDVLDITTSLTAVETLLVERGAEIERGVATARALEAYHDAARV